MPPISRSADSPPEAEEVDSDGDFSDGDESSLSSAEEFAFLPQPGGNRGRSWLRSRAGTGDDESGVTKEEMKEAAGLLRLLEDPPRPFGGAAARVACAGASRSAARRAVRYGMRQAAQRMKEEDPRSALLHLFAANGLCRAVQSLPTHASSAKSGGKAARKAVEAQAQLRKMKEAAAGASDKDLQTSTSKAFRDLRARVVEGLETLIKLGEDAHRQPSEEEQKEKMEIRATHKHEEGIQLREQGQLEESLACFQEVLDLRLKTVGPDHAHAALARSFIATVLRDIGDLQGAMEQLRESLRVQIACLGEDHPHVAVSRSNIGAVLKHQGQPELALIEHRAALGVLVRHYGGEDHTFVAEVREHIGHALRLMSDLRGAVEEYRRALEIRERVLGEEHPKTIRLREKLAEMDTSWAAPRCMRIGTPVEGEAHPDWECPGAGCNNYSNIGAASVCAQCGYRRPLPAHGVSQIFAEMVFVFTGVIPKSIHPSSWKEWRFAEQRGAKVNEDLTDDTTHVIYRQGYDRSDKVQRAEQMPGVRIVSVNWFYQSVNMDVALHAELFDPRSRFHREFRRGERNDDDDPDVPARAHSAPVTRAHMNPPAPRKCTPPPCSELPDPKPLIAVGGFDAAPPPVSDVCPPMLSPSHVLRDGAGSPAHLRGLLSREERQRAFANAAAAGDADAEVPDAAAAAAAAARSSASGGQLQLSGAHSPIPLRPKRRVTGDALPPVSPRPGALLQLDRLHRQSSKNLRADRPEGQPRPFAPFAAPKAAKPVTPGESLSESDLSVSLRSPGERGGGAFLTVSPVPGSPIRPKPGPKVVAPPPPKKQDSALAGLLYSAPVPKAGTAAAAAAPGGAAPAADGSTKKDEWRKTPGKGKQVGTPPTGAAAGIFVHSGPVPKPSAKLS